MRLHRAAKRDDVHEESVRKRMQHQLSENEYLQRADNVIRNDGAASLIEQVAQLLALCQES
jgi:dephospho-CoA kinase